MRDETKLAQGKEEYRGPDIVEVGDVVASTTGGGEPVGERPITDPPTYYNAAEFNMEGAPEVELGDE
jgi:hypothetical protein